MSDHQRNLAIFRGTVKFKNNTQKILGVFYFLTFVTAIEVVLGILRPESLFSTFLSLKIINWIFIILTIIKAYYITWDFMHLRDEKKFLQWTITFPLIFFIPYLCFILLNEGDYIYEIMRASFITWNF